MKSLPLITKDIKIGEQTVPLSSKGLLIGALDSYQEGLKGIKNINLTMTIYKKIEQITEGMTYIEFEDAEYEMLYKAIDQCQWTPIVLRFGEFFEGLKKE